MCKTTYFHDRLVNIFKIDWWVAQTTNQLFVFYEFLYNWTGFSLTEHNPMFFLGGVYIKMLSKGSVWFLDN